MIDTLLALKPLCKFYNENIKTYKGWGLLLQQQTRNEEALTPWPSWKPKAQKIELEATALVGRE